MLIDEEATDYPLVCAKAPPHVWQRPLYHPGQNHHQDQACCLG